MSSKPGEIWLQGTPLAPGVALGRACCFKQETCEHSENAPGNLEREAHRLNEALAWMRHRLTALAQDTEARLGSQEAEIFIVHQMLLEDESFQQRLKDAVEADGLTAVIAVERQLDRYKAELQTADSEYLRQRVADITEIQRGLLDHLCRIDSRLHCKDAACSIGECLLGNDHVLVCRELTASLPIEMDSHTVGFLLEKSGLNSHAAIIARAMQLPAVSGIYDLPASIPLEAQILINGDTGKVALNPSDETIARAQSFMAKCQRSVEVMDPIPELKVLANIERATDVQDAIAARAEGIGLYRTEVEVLAKGRLLSGAEQLTRYLEAAEAMPDRPVCIRLLDFGADKTAPWLETTFGECTERGLRGAQLLLANPRLIREQARALARAARHREIQVLYPMIIDLSQYRRLRALFEDAIFGLRSPKLLHGAMFEVPSACLQARQILQESDFGCIGTNDLTQYLFATDRTRCTGPDDTRFDDHPVLWRLLEDVAKAARALNKPMSLCGELAGDPVLIPKIMNAGIHAVSTSTAHIAEVRRAAQTVKCRI